MQTVERLVTVVELDQRTPDGHSAWAQLYVVLSSGERRLLLDDRGWTSGHTDIAHQGRRNIENTARMVVGPDEPGPGETPEQMDTWYWEWMEHKLHDAGIAAEAAQLRTLSHDVEIGDLLRRRLATSSGSG